MASFDVDSANAFRCVSFLARSISSDSRTRSGVPDVTAVVRILILSAVLTTFVGCTQVRGGDVLEVEDCGDRLQPAARTELFFGLTHAGGEAIAEAEWDDYLANSVTPRFPGGLSVLEARGQWRNPATGVLVRQPARVLIIVHSADASSDAAIDDLREDYRQRFEQISVLRVTQPVCAAF